ncbi:hypothetical protein VTK26DRAFT_7382 [Humicola hyalothermophila]
MSGLHRRAVKGGKTLSNKARSKPESGISSTNHSPTGSPANSRAGSRVNSRPGSRYASEDEYASDDDFDAMTADTDSITGEEEQVLTDGWADRLQDQVAALQERKNSSVQGREASLRLCIHVLKHHFARRQLEKSASDMLLVCLRSIRHAGSDEECLRALRAFTLTLLTCPSNDTYEQALPVLKGACHDGEQESIKVAAIQALCIAVSCGGGSAEAAEEVLDFLLEIVESDGASVNAADSGEVVTAALQAWAFVASDMEELTDQGEAAMEAFIDQLDSTDPEVQVAAGSNIALLFEHGRDYEAETGESFNMQYNQHRIMTRMAEISRGAAKGVSRKGRRNLRANFASIATSLERGKGPGYSTAGRSGQNPHTGGSKMEEAFQEFGYRNRIRVHNQFVLIRTWSLHARAEMLRILLGGGFGEHYLENPLVREILSDADVEFISSVRPRK